MKLPDGEKLICVFCRATYTKEMLEAYKGTFNHGSDSNFYAWVRCDNCDKIVYKK